MLFLVVLSLCLASSLGAPSLGYSYSAYAPVSYSSLSYTPYSSLLTPYALKSSYVHAAPTVYAAPAPVVAPHVAVAQVVHSAPTAYVEASGLKTQYHTQDGHGQASYGHSEPHQSHNAVQDAAGNKIGSFSYVKPDGQVHRTDYVADAAGYRVASNDLPVGPAAAPAAPHAPEVPVVHETPVIVEAPTVPAETPEVISAKAAHFAAHAAATHGLHSVYKRSIYGYAPAPVVTPSGHLADTPEVAAAKAAHFAEHAKRGNYHYGAPYYAHSGAYYGPYASPVVTPSGYLADTPEVAAAKAAHFAEKAKVSHHYNAIPYTGYTSYAAAPVVTPSGHIADTPEVAAAKAAHFAEHAAAAARSAHHAAPAHSYAYAPYSHSYYDHAVPVVTPSGHLADTPEVAHAKAAHLAEFAAVASRQKRSAVLYGQTPASTVPLATPVAYAAYPYAHSYAHSYAYSAPVYSPYSYYPKLYSAFPYLKPATHSAVVHGPHAVSYQLAH